MRIERYLNGRLLPGALPPLRVDGTPVAALLRDAAGRQQLPLPPAAPSAILEAEESGRGKGTQ